MFERPHHQRIARVLHALDGDRLRSLQCWFGGGTAIALRHGEYRESIDIDFLVSDLAGYRQLRQFLRPDAVDIAPLLRADAPALQVGRPIRADQYGIRTNLVVDGVGIKFEIVHEARIAFALPSRIDAVCGVATLGVVDMAACKLLANADRWRDDSVFGRDAMDLAMMDLPPRRLRPAVEKAAAAYGPLARGQMIEAIDAFGTRPGWLPKCMDALSMTMPAAVVQQRLRALRRRLETLV